MAKVTDDDIRSMVACIRRPEGVAFLTGAGCSLSAGIPLAPTLVKELHAAYPEEMSGVAPEMKDDYGACMGALPVALRETVLKPYLDDAKINWANVALASLLKDKRIARILTFNFDHVLARACGLLGQYPAIYDFGVAATAETRYLASPCVIHLHGQGFGRIMLNTAEETREHAELVRPVIRDTLERYPLFVIGYSGEADPVFQQIIEEYKGRHHLWWLGHSEECKPHLNPLFQPKYKNFCRYIGGADADIMLIRLATELTCFPPDVMTKPAEHLIEEFRDVAPFPFRTGGITFDPLDQVRKRLDKHGRNLHMPELEQAAMRGDEQEIARIEKAALSGKASRDGEDINRESSRKVRAWAHFARGTELLERGKVDGDAVLLEQACREFEKALAFDPNFHEALSNWGTALVDLAKMKQDETLFQMSCEKFATALSNKPGLHEVLYNWGIALSDLAKMKQDETLFQVSFEKYAEALTIKPDYYAALNNWGIALADLAKMKQDESLFQESFEKYAEALKIKPDLHEALNNWGAGLAAAWHLTKKRDYLDKAREVLDRHETLNPDMPYNRACVAALLGDEAGCRLRLERARTTGDLPGRDALIGDPDLESMRDKDWFKALLAGDAPPPAPPLPPLPS